MYRQTSLYLLPSSKTGIIARETKMQIMVQQRFWKLKKYLSLKTKQKAQNENRATIRIIVDKYLFVLAVFSIAPN